jgi:hypothetical protein
MKQNILKYTSNWFVQNNRGLASHDAVIMYIGLLTIIIMPFAFIELTQGHYQVFLMEILAILLILTDIIFTQYYHRSFFLRSLNMSGLGIIIWFLVFQKGIIGVFTSNLKLSNQD